jgi:hypothetical protein
MLGYFELPALYLEHLEKFLLEIRAINFAGLLDGSLARIPQVSRPAPLRSANVLLDLIPNEFSCSFPNGPEDQIDLLFCLEAKGLIGVGLLGIDTESKIDRDLHFSVESRRGATTTAQFVMSVPGI